MVIPFAGGWGLFQLWGKGQVESIFLGTALTATSVGITAQVLASKGLLRHTASGIIPGAAVDRRYPGSAAAGSGDERGAGKSQLARAGADGSFPGRVYRASGALGRQDHEQVIPRLEANLRLGEAHFALAMVLLFGLAAASTKVGVAAIIGAFLAGMALTDALPSRVHDLAHGVTELLVPFFLANIGLHVRLSVFREGQMITLALLIIPIAMFTKVLGCGLGASRFGRTVAIRVGTGMIPRGEFCMVVAQVGLELKAISTENYSLIVFMAITVAMLTPPLLKLVFRGVLTPAPPKRNAFTWAETAPRWYSRWHPPPVSRLCFLRLSFLNHDVHGKELVDLPMAGHRLGECRFWGFW